MYTHKHTNEVEVDKVEDASQVSLTAEFTSVIVASFATKVAFWWWVGSLKWTPRW